MGAGRQLALAAYFIFGIAAVSLGPRVAVGEQFHFYVWGNDIPSLNVFYADGVAVFTDYATASKTDNLIPVTFSMAKSGPSSDSTGSHGGFTFTVKPDTAAPVNNLATRSPPFETATLFVPERTSPSHSVGFLSGAVDAIDSPMNARTDGFVLGDGFFKFLRSDGRVLMPAYCAFPTETPGVWSLAWNVTAGLADGFPVTLRLARGSSTVPMKNIESNPCRILP